ncbi:MAG: hypothetical protein ABH842_05520 [Candidatus Micrarchaeota archaeon]
MILRPKKEFLKEYNANLILVLNEVKGLNEHLPGKTIITSDHGEACGERDPVLKIPVYGHPSHSKLPVLIEIPWFIVDNKNSKIKNKKLSNLKSKISKLRAKMNKKL